MTDRLVSGEMAPSSGHVRFRGTDITGLPQHRVCRLGIAKSYQIFLSGGEQQMLDIARGLVARPLEVAMALSHRLYAMDQGRIQFEGTPEALRKDPTIQQRFLQL